MAYTPEREAALERYAHILATVAGGVTADRPVLIDATSVDHHTIQFAIRLARVCYEQGASHVEIMTTIPELIPLQYAFASEEFKTFVSPAIETTFVEAMKYDGTVIILKEESLQAISEEVPGNILRAVSDNTSRYMRTFQEAKAQKRVTYTLARVASVAWARREFPDVSDDEAVDALWSHILAYTNADQEDAVERWHMRRSEMSELREKLEKMNITELHFSGSTVDLRVRLAEGAVWQMSASETTDGRMFMGNMPSYELFTAPHRLHVEGTVETTRPSIIDGVVIDRIAFTFEEGRVTHAKASNRQDVIDALVSTTSADRMGEIALVNVRSPLAQQERILNAVLFLENAGCHFALGHARANWIAGGMKLSPKERIDAGMNDESLCDAHQDFVFGSSNVSVYAVGENNQEELVMENGEYISRKNNYSP